MQAVYSTGLCSRSSWCIYQRDEKGNRRLLRLLDVRSDNQGNVLYRWVCDPDKAGRQHYGLVSDPDNPVAFYYSRLVGEKGQSRSDFRLVQWQPNYAKPDLPQVDLQMADSGRQSQTSMPHLYEVIDCPESRSVRELRDGLAKGIPYEGRPTAQVLVMFSTHADHSLFDAAILNREQLVIENGRIRLAEHAPYSVPVVTVSGSDLQWIPMGFTGHNGHKAANRILYTRPTLPKSERKAIIRPLSEYVRKYVDWFVTSENALSQGGTPLDRADAILRAALNAPDRLEEFLGAPPGSDDLKRVKSNVDRILDSKSDAMSSMFDAVTKRKRDLEQSIRDLEEQARQHSETIDRLRALEETSRQDAEKAQRHFEDVRADLDRRTETLLRDQELAEQDLKHLDDEREQALQRIDDDIALKLGLRAAAGGSRAGAALAGPEPLGPQLDVVDGDGFAQAVGANLRSLGVGELRGDSAIRTLAERLDTALAVTRLLAVDTSVAAAVATALAYALAGAPAGHVGVPADWSDGIALSQAIDGCDAPVMMLDNVLDTVNEGLLFVLARQRHETVVILPVGSHANLLLLAPEIWSQVTFLPTDGLMQLPVERPTALSRAQRPSGRRPLASRVLECAAELGRATDWTLPAGELSLPASLLAAGGGDANAGETRRWVAAQLALQLSGRIGQERTGRALAGFLGDAPLPELLGRLKGVPRG